MRRLTFISLALSGLVWPLAGPAGSASEFKLRETHFVVYSVEAGKQVAYDITPRGRGTATQQPIAYVVQDISGRSIAASDSVFGTVQVHYTPPGGGINLARIAGNRNWYTVGIPNGAYGIVTSKFHALHMTGDERPVYFYVPDDAKSLRLYLSGDRREGATVQVIAPDGSLATETTVRFNEPHTLEAKVAQGQDGKVWSFRVADPRLKGEQYGLDDVVVYFSDNVAPLVSLNPDVLVTLLQAIPGALGMGVYGSLEDLDQTRHEFVDYSPSMSPEVVERNYSGWQAAVKRVL